MRKAIYSLLLATAWVAWFGVAFIAHIAADQSSLSSPTTGTVSGLQLTNNYNAAINALNTCNSGTSAPTNQLSAAPSLGNCWLDTSSAGYAQIKYYDGASWILQGVIDTTNHRLYTVWEGDVNVGLTAGATTDLCGSPLVRGAIVFLTGSATITSFGTSCPAGTIKMVWFSGAQAVTSSSTLAMAGGQSGTPTGGTVATFVFDGTNWYNIGYFPRTVAVSCAAGVPSSSFTVQGGIVTHC